MKSFLLVFTFIVSILLNIGKDVVVKVLADIVVKAMNSVKTGKGRSVHHKVHLSRSHVANKKAPSAKISKKRLSN